MNKFFDYKEFDYVEYIEFTIGEDSIEVPFRLHCEYEAPERDVGFVGGVTINDITLAGKSIYTDCGAIAEAIHDKIRSMELELNEKASEYIQKIAEDEYAAYCDYQYDMLRDRQMEREI